MKKRIFYTEAAYGVGQVLLAFGTALIAHGGLGISMVVAPAYILHLKLSQLWQWFSFGMAEYLLQILVLAVMMLILKKAKAIYFLSILSAVAYGFLLDGAMLLVTKIPVLGFWSRLGIYSLGVIFSTASLSLLFYSYLPPAAYEMLVMRISSKFQLKVTRVKTVYDLCSLGLSVVLSLVLLGNIQGIGIGTVVCAVCYGFFISLLCRLFSHFWDFKDRFLHRPIFDESEKNYE